MGLDNIYGLGSLRPGVCTSTSRPASPFEGQTIYETDTDRLATWDGSAWIAYVRQTAGKVLQVVSTAKTDSFSAASTSYTDITGLSATITPSSSSSKILISANTNGSIVAYIQLLRDSTAIFIGDTAGSRVRATQAIYATAQNIPTASSFVYLDSPNTTSAVTYKLQGRAESGTFYINRGSTDTDAGTSYPRTASSITVMEISG